MICVLIHISLSAEASTEKNSLRKWARVETTKLFCTSDARAGQMSWKYRKEDDESGLSARMGGVNAHREKLSGRAVESMSMAHLA